jgi:hypothetical protein
MKCGERREHSVSRRRRRQRQHENGGGAAPRGGDYASVARHFEEVPLHARVDAFLEELGANKLLDIATSILSFVTVCTYIASTYGVIDTNLFDLVVGCFFAAEWLFRAWKAPSRLAFVFSWWSLVDVVTFLPMIVLNVTRNL